MSNVILGVFSDRTMAEDAIEELKAIGYNPKEMSFMMRGSAEVNRISGTDVVGDTLGGAVTGVIIGGLAGLAASFIVPGLGAFFIGGPLATALGLTGTAATTASGAATGALAGGIIGALSSAFGLSQEDAETYAKRIEQGGILIAVPARQGEEREAMAVMTDFNADNVKMIEAFERIEQREGRPSEKYSPAYFSDIRGKGRRTISGRHTKRRGPAG